MCVQHARGVSLSGTGSW